ncbi:MAG: DUF4345 family protein [bacterium]
MTRLFLAANALLWLPYGLYCFLVPEFLVEAAAVSATASTGTIELRAMYGGLQAGIGALCAAGAMREELERPALLLLLFLACGLALARSAGAVMAAELSSYTGSALLLEYTLAAASAWLLRSGSGAQSS